MPRSVSSKTLSSSATRPESAGEQAGDHIDQRGLAAARTPEQGDDPGSGQLEFRVQQKCAATLLGSYLEHQRPNIRRTRRANHSDNNNPPSPSAQERIARRAASLSPPGVCRAV